MMRAQQPQPLRPAGPPGRRIYPPDMNVFAALFGTKHARDVKRLRPIVAKINAYDEEYKALTDEQLKAKTSEFKERVAGGESLDAILPEAFAAVTNACRRLLGTKCTVCGLEPLKMTLCVPPALKLQLSRLPA